MKTILYFTLLLALPFLTSAMYDGSSRYMHHRGPLYHGMGRYRSHPRRRPAVRPQQHPRQIPPTPRVREDVDSFTLTINRCVDGWGQRSCDALLTGEKLRVVGPNIDKTYSVPASLIDLDRVRARHDGHGSYHIILPKREHRKRSPSQSHGAYNVVLPKREHRKQAPSPSMAEPHQPQRRKEGDRRRRSAIAVGGTTPLVGKDVGQQHDKATQTITVDAVNSHSGDEEDFIAITDDGIEVLDDVDCVDNDDDDDEWPVKGWDAVPGYMTERGEWQYY